MSFLIYFITFFNLLGLIYLFYLIYRRNQSTSRLNNSNGIDIPPAPTKIHLTRYNPFGEIGGDQSFILCILDSTNSGVIITSLHNRDFTRVYAKAVKNGNSEAVGLSAEEKTALKLTINS